MSVKSMDNALAENVRFSFYFILYVFACLFVCLTV